MIIAIVCARLGIGGAERVAVMWAKGFLERGHHVFLVSNLFEEQTYHVDERIRLYNLVSTNGNKIKKWCSAVLNVRKMVQHEKPDVIIGVMETCSLVAKLATIGKGIPVVMTEHYAFERPGKGLSWSERLSKFHMNSFYNAVSVLAEADKKVIGNRLKNVYVMPNPLALMPIQEVLTGQKTLLAVGRLDAWYVKGFDVLIKAFSKLVQSSSHSEAAKSSAKFKVQNEGWKLKIAGTGNDESLNYLKQLCKENGVEDSVEFLGFRKDVEKLYQDASVFVLSSRYEGFGLVLIEAMSQGCACIACDYKGRQKDIINPSPSLPQGEEVQPKGIEVCENGILCKPDNVDELAEALKKMITDDKYRESTRQNAIERSKYYSIENTMNRWEKLLNQVTNNH